ncbi:hypothetical protein EMGBS15_17820 [Filimonas sp.]|nr:hypothetical protein EMGBS15_17820 [Filimonas sp.]
MEYNTTRELMKIREYGRNVHDMVKQLLIMDDKEKRQRNAEAIIEIMAILNPQASEMEDYRHKLWDHLFLISDYKLDVECPYEIPTQEVKQRKPEPLPYPKNKIRWNHFGKSFEKIYDKAIVETDEEKKQGYIQVLALFMKVAYSNWHKESIHDDMIKDELSLISKGQLVYDPATKFKDFVDSSDLPTINPVNPQGLSKRAFNRNNNNRGNNNNNRNPNMGGMGNMGNNNRNNKFKFKKKNNANNL